MTEQPSPRKRAPRAAPWPTFAGRVADDLVAVLITTRDEGRGVNGNAAAITRLAETCIEQIDDGNLFMAKRLLRKMGEFSGALETTGTNIAERSETARAALAAARRGEYGGEG